MRLKELKQVCFEEMLVFDASNEVVFYTEEELVVNHESEEYDDYIVVNICDSCTTEHFMYVAIAKELKEFHGI